LRSSQSTIAMMVFPTGYVKWRALRPRSFILARYH
jgi:hypothetical protein